jgi:hypothetical protein
VCGIGRIEKKGWRCDEKQGKRLRSEARRPLESPKRENQVRTMDFAHDGMVNGRKSRTLNLMVTLGKRWPSRWTRLCREHRLPNQIKTTQSQSASFFSVPLQPLGR